MDARVVNTTETVRRIFLELLAEKPIRKISVTEICTKAGINRTTFYKHYLDVYDLMDQTEEYVLTSFQEKLDDMVNRDLRGALIDILGYMKRYASQFGALFGPNGNPDLMVRLSKLCYPLFQRNADMDGVTALNDELDKLCYSYISAGCTGILGYWMQYHFEQEPEVVADLILKLVKLTMDGMESSFTML
ncbi:MAG: TetR/AcrR family transcriptional regulator C-terminal domain-containing protein [Eubacteriales bacterium]|nr:TetR/AcrR family transcriptional regulator C-terminal domain-containing protein [Eubacteriales bacterium]